MDLDRFVNQLAEKYKSNQKEEKSFNRGDILIFEKDPLKGIPDKFLEGEYLVVFLGEREALDYGLDKKTIQCGIIRKELQGKGSQKDIIFFEKGSLYWETANVIS